MAALATGGSSLLKNPNDMYVAMLRSRTVEDGMIDHFGLMQEYHKRYLSDARKKFEHYATVDGNGKDGLIHISVEDQRSRAAPPSLPMDMSINSATSPKIWPSLRPASAGCFSSSNSSRRIRTWQTPKRP